VAAHALVEVFGRFRGPFASLRFAYPRHQVETRPDGLRVPSMDDVRTVGT
jgi:hypothetical protein